MKYLILFFTICTAYSQDFNTITLNGITCSINSEWTIISHTPMGAITSVAVQIPNSADEGTQDSTNLIISVYDNKDTQATLTFVERIMSIKDYKEETHGKWKQMIWTGRQGETNYNIIDSVLQENGKTASILVRLAFPILKNNANDYSEKIMRSLNFVLDSVKQ